jgi:DNA repair exonuclease SbcCD ATPase subunit
MAKGMTQKRMVGPVTPQMYDEVLDEVDTVTEKLNEVRAELWETQDELKEAKVDKQQLQAYENFSAKDKETMKMLELKLNESQKRERDTRDALDLMKRVFTRTQLKAKDDQAVIQKIKETNRWLAEENINLLQSLVNAAQEELFGDESPSEERKDNTEKLTFDNYGSIDMGKKLADKLKETKRADKLKETKRADKLKETKRDLEKNRTDASKNRIAGEAATKIEKQQNEIKKLKKQLAEERKEDDEESIGLDATAALFFSQMGFTACDPSMTAVAV